MANFVVSARPFPKKGQQNHARRSVFSHEMAILELQHIRQKSFDQGGHMIKTLVLVRHGDTEAVSESGSDLDRKLTLSALHALEGAYPRTFELLGDDPEVQIWASPAVRALQTAAVVSDAVGGADIEVHQSLYDQDIQAFLSETEASDAQTVIAVGHVPFMNSLLRLLTSVDLTFGKGAAAAVELSEGKLSGGRLMWFVTGPETKSWEVLSSVEWEMADAARGLLDRSNAFFEMPDDVEALRQFRIALRRVRSLLQFLAPWQAKKQNRHYESYLSTLLDETERLRALDILSITVDGLVDSGELGKNSLLPVACAKERALECSSAMDMMRKNRARKQLKKLADEMTEFRWKSKVLEGGLSEKDFQEHFDEELDALDNVLFGLDLTNADVVAAARNEAKDFHYVAERLGGVLGPERAIMSEYMDDIQTELGALSEARRNQKIANECSKAPRFRGVRADLGVVARDQSEVVSAILAGLRRVEVDGKALGDE